MTIYIFIGPPGSGKSTQAKMLVEQRQADYFASGQQLRMSMEKQDTIGKEIKSYQDKGELVPDRLVDSLVTDFFVQEFDKQNDVVFDGYPRNLTELNYLDKIAKQNNLTIIGVNISLPDQIASQRLIERAKSQGFKHRDDDNPEIIKHRLEIYHNQTEPLIRALKEDHQLLTINGQPSIEQVSSQLQSTINQTANGSAKT